ncbi:hypothetical protein PR048_021398 [Dryococelus australis]|uniref:Uncharacterized protein n=1 Tax=Dryococelus australis TaxID=614101 RepID=A0ABQ9GY51_9NEOP|nr:hypothetical protein PR048_021398 [Dryococelus australis]
MSCWSSTAPVGVKKYNFLYLTTPLVSLDEGAQETKKDEVLSKVIKVCENSLPLLHQLSIRDGVLLNGNRVGIPQSLQAKML